MGRVGAIKRLLLQRPVQTPQQPTGLRWLHWIASPLPLVPQSILPTIRGRSDGNFAGPESRRTVPTANDTCQSLQHGRLAAQHPSHGLLTWRLHSVRCCSQLNVPTVVVIAGDDVPAADVRALETDEVQRDALPPSGSRGRVEGWGGELVGTRWLISAVLMSEAPVGHRCAQAAVDGVTEVAQQRPTSSPFVQKRAAAAPRRAPAPGPARESADAREWSRGRR